jgi:phosphoglycolate phosphatase-like HAD superfamily hydrolase
MNIETIIFDLDGVLCEDSGLNPDNFTWELFKGICVELNPLLRGLELFDMYVKEQYHITLMTARPIALLEETKLWLEAQDLHPDLLLFRYNGMIEEENAHYSKCMDTESRIKCYYEIHAKHKEILIKKLLSMNYTPVIAIDDQKQNIKLFQKYGIPTMYVSFSSKSWWK